MVEHRISNEEEPMSQIKSQVCRWHAVGRRRDAQSAAAARMLAAAERAFAPAGDSGGARRRQHAAWRLRASSRCAAEWRPGTSTSATSAARRAPTHCATRGWPRRPGLTTCRFLRAGARDTGRARPGRGGSALCGLLEPVGEFDLVLLGLGEDGHTGSLFPGHELGPQRRRAELPCRCSTRRSRRPSA